MNQRETDALCDNELPHLAVALYIRCFRANMDYTSGTVFVSYRGMAQALEHTPPRGSTTPASKPSKEQLRQAIRQLLRVGLIKLVEAGALAHNRAAQYRCNLAFLGANEEPHENPTGTPRSNPTTQTQATRGIAPNVVNFRNREEPHIPDKPIDDDEMIARANLEFSAEWLALARSVGLAADEEQIHAWFVTWSENDSSHIYRAMTAHKKAWRNYCVKIKANRPNLGSGHHAQHKPHVSKYADEYERNCQSVQQCVEAGIDGSVFEEAIEARRAVKGDA